MKKFLFSVFALVVCGCVTVVCPKECEEFKIESPPNMEHQTFETEKNKDPWGQDPAEEGGYDPL